MAASFPSSYLHWLQGPKCSFASKHDDHYEYSTMYNGENPRTDLYIIASGAKCSSLKADAYQDMYHDDSRVYSSPSNN